MRRRGKRGRGEGLPTVMIAFGAGLVLALFCSVRLALFVAAVLLIYFGVTSKSR